MEKKAKGLVEYAKAQLGKPYWYGTFGQGANKSLYNQKKKQYPLQYLWNYKGESEKVHDCVGLIKGYLWCDSTEDTAPKYNAAQDFSANSMRDACKISGSISTLPEVPGTLVFMNGHTGVYIGNGEVIEARNRKYGVVKTKLKNRPWKTWGYCPFVDYSEPKEPEKTEQSTIKVELPVLKKGSKGQSVKSMQILLIGYNYFLGGYGADGSFGGATEKAVKSFQKDKGLTVDGSCGRKTWNKLLGLE